MTRQIGSRRLFTSEAFSQPASDPTSVARRFLRLCRPMSDLNGKSLCGQTSSHQTTELIVLVIRRESSRFRIETRVRTRKSAMPRISVSAGCGKCRGHYGRRLNGRAQGAQAHTSGADHPFRPLWVNRKRVQRLMGIESFAPKRRTTRPGAGHKTYPYLRRNLSLQRRTLSASAEFWRRASDLGCEGTREQSSAE